MGCNSDHMNPTEKEKNNKEACEHITYLHDIKGNRPPSWAAASCYGSTKPLNEVVYILCQMCEEASEDVIYNGRDPKARKLADWWDAHQEADRNRVVHFKMAYLVVLPMTGIIFATYAMYRMTKTENLSYNFEIMIEGRKAYCGREGYLFIENKEKV